MKHPSLLRSLALGLAWGSLFALLSSLVLPVLFAMIGFDWDTFVFTFFVLQFGKIIFVITLIQFSLPSIIGGVALAMSVRWLASTSARPLRTGLWLGVITGCIVALVGIAALQWGPGRFNFDVPWLFGILITAWQIAIYVWLGRRLARSFHV